jgi:hypothetical protein
MNRSTSASIGVLIFVWFISAALLQGCETIYTSSIIIPKDIEPFSKDAAASKQDERINMLFDDYCANKIFQVKPLQGAKVSNESQTKGKMCSAQWFYSVHFEDHQTEYKIELSLIQPWSLRNSEKQERFFCRETDEMFDFFKAGLTHEKATYKPYASCSQIKGQQ